MCACEAWSHDFVREKQWTGDGVILGAELLYLTWLACALQWHTITRLLVFFSLFFFFCLCKFLSEPSRDRSRGGREGAAKWMGKKRRGEQVEEREIDLASRETTCWWRPLIVRWIRRPFPPPANSYEPSAPNPPQISLWLPLNCLLT